jgi:ABC-type transport system involved in multi-copper enzyme maturation permease subunit
MKLAYIAMNTFRECVRDRVLYNLIFFALLLIGSSFFIGELAIGGEQKIIVDLGLSSMRFFGTLIAIFIGIQLVFKEIERRTIYSLLAKPIFRHEFILGKFFGLGMTLAVNSAVMLAGILLTLAVLEGGISRLMLPVIPAAYLIFLELLVVTGVALTLSTFSSPALSAVMTFMVYLAGHFSSDFRSMAQSNESPVTSGILYALYYLLPNFSNFNAIPAASYGEFLPTPRILGSTLYAILYCGVLLSIAVISFRGRDFK